MTYLSRFGRLIFGARRLQILEPPLGNNCPVTVPLVAVSPVKQVDNYALADASRTAAHGITTAAARALERAAAVGCVVPARRAGLVDPHSNSRP